MFAGVLLAIGSLASPAVAQVVSGHLFGLTLSNNGGSPNTTIDVAAGDATDSTNTYSMQLASAFSKVLQTSGSWTAGTGNNGLDTGARAANTWYHVYLIRKDADGTSDVLFSTSVSSPTMPSGYTAFRRIGSVRTNGSNNIFAFTQTGDEFIWSTASYDVQGVNVGTTSTQYTLSVPSGVKVIARVRAVNDPTGTTTSQITIRSPDESTSQNSTFVTGSGHQLQAHSGNSIATEVLVRTNTASQVAAISNVASGNVFHVRTVGWFDGRGK
jgi:hypothetical protein